MTSLSPVFPLPSAPMESQNGDLNEYEARRLRNIQDNERFISELELPILPSDRNCRQKARKKGRSNDHGSFSVGRNDAVHKNSKPRRSKRIANSKVSDEVKTETELSKANLSSFSIKHEAGTDDFGRLDDVVWNNEKQSKSDCRLSTLQRNDHKPPAGIFDGLDDEAFVKQPKLVSHSVKSCVDIDARLEDMDSILLGKVLLPPEGEGSFKATAMRTIAKSPPRFSKYSGIQPFKNCIVLFVNAFPRGQSPGYDNYPRKSPGGSEIIIPWFAQARHCDKTPVVKRLLDPKEKVFLLCRCPAQPYICCGSLKLIEADLKVSPIRFEWLIFYSSVLEKSSEAWRKLIQYWMAE